MYPLWTTERVRETNALFVKASIDAHGTPLTEETLAAAKAADAVILGAVGGPVKHPHSYSRSHLSFSSIPNVNCRNGVQEKSALSKASCDCAKN